MHALNCITSNIFVVKIYMKSDISSQIIQVLYAERCLFLMPPFDRHKRRMVKKVNSLIRFLNKKIDAVINNIHTYTSIKRERKKHE